jgi:hypothetical protein
MNFNTVGQFDTFDHTVCWYQKCHQEDGLITGRNM